MKMEFGSGYPKDEQKDRQTKFDLGVPEHLSKKEFAIMAEKVLREYGEKSASTFYKIVREGRGKEILGSVSERGAETEIALESSLEHMFTNTCIEKELPIYIIGEHHNYLSPDKTNGVEREHVACFDSADDTREFEQGGPESQGLPAPLWTVVSIYDLDGPPIAGVIVNLKERKMYLSANEKNFLIDLETREEKEIRPSNRTSIKDKDFCLATYFGDPKYFVSFAENFLEIQKELRDNGINPINQPHSGAFIYGPMAEGTVDAYLIAREPVSEQLPGWAFAQIAGFKAWEINPENGTCKEVKHDYRKLVENPNEYRKGRMPMYLVTRSDNVRDEIAFLVVKNYKAKKDRETRDRFIAERHEEFELWRRERELPKSPIN